MDAKLRYSTSWKKKLNDWHCVAVGNSICSSDGSFIKALQVFPSTTIARLVMLTSFMSSKRELAMLQSSTDTQLQSEK
jgi:hypothetical protein